jgi:predicted nuclease of predicted toxin-antitoxin system
VRLLFDENLSPDLPRLLAGEFPDSAHLRNLGLVGADDAVIWQAAAAQGFTLVSKDDDFLELAILRGAPPKVVAIGLGNCRTAEVAALLRSAKDRMERFAQDPNASLLELP